MGQTGISVIPDSYDNPSVLLTMNNEDVVSNRNRRREIIEGRKRSDSIRSDWVIVEKADDDQLIFEELQINSGKGDGFTEDIQDIFDTVESLEKDFIKLRNGYNKILNFHHQEFDETEHRSSKKRLKKLRKEIDKSIDEMKLRLEDDDLVLKVLSNKYKTKDENVDQNEKRVKLFTSLQKRVKDVREEFDETMLYFLEMRREEVREMLSEGSDKEVTEEMISEYIDSEDRKLEEEKEV